MSDDEDAASVHEDMNGSAPSSSRKPGNQGNFHGEELALLQSHLPAFLDANSVKKVKDFWPTVLSHFWRAFGMPDNETVVRVTPAKSNKDEDGATARDGNGRAGRKKRVRVTKEKQWTAKDVQIEQIKNWYNYRRHNTSHARKNPFAHWLRGLRKGPRTAPHRQFDYQYYMTRDGHRERIAEVFEETWDSVNGRPEDALGFRCDIARRLLKAEPEEVQVEIRETVNRAHEDAVKRWEDTPEAFAEDLTDPTEIREARLRLATVVQPLLNGIRAHTKLNLTLLAGSPPDEADEEFFITSLHSGTTRGANPQDFTQWNRVLYDKLIIGLFSRFVRDTAENPLACPLDEDEDLERMLQQTASRGSSHSGSRGQTPIAPGRAARQEQSKTPPPSSSRASTARAVAPLRPSGEGAAAPSQPSGRGAPLQPSTAATAPSRPSIVQRLPLRGPTPPPPPSREPTPPPPPSREHTPPPPSPPSRVIGSPLQQELDQMGARDRDRRTRELNRMQMHMFVRENNLAFQRRLMKELDLEAARDGVVQKGPRTRPKARPVRKEIAESGPTIEPRRSARHQGPSTQPSAAPPAALRAESAGPSGAAPPSTAPPLTAPPLTAPPSTAPPLTAPPLTAPPSTAPPSTAPPLTAPPSTAPSSATASTLLPPAKAAGSLSAAPRSTGPHSTAIPSAAPTPSTAGPAGLSATLRAPSPAENSSGAGPGPSDHTSAPPRFLEAPEWMKLARELLDNADYGERWSSCVEDWAALEEAYGYASPLGGLGLHRRPPHVQWWIRRARLPERSLPILDLDEFIRDWKAWWGSCNPNWRQPEGAGLPMTQNAEGSLEVLRKPGKNGILSVLAALKWWRDAEGGNSSEWAAAVDDVSGVVARLLEEETGSRKRKGTDIASPAAKKTRV